MRRWDQKRLKTSGSTDIQPSALLTRLDPHAAARAASLRASSGIGSVRIKKKVPPKAVVSAESSVDCGSLSAGSSASTMERALSKMDESSVTRQ